MAAAPRQLPRKPAASGQDQAAYSVATGAKGVSLANPANGFTAQVQLGKLEVSAGADTWEMSLVGVGYEDRTGSSKPPGVQPLGTAVTTVSGNRVDSNYGTVDAWYVNGPGGLEQGFTLTPQPGAGTSLTVELALRGDLVGKIDAAGDGFTLTRLDGTRVLDYTGLKVYDAAGNVLPASLQLETVAGGQELLIQVNEAGARGPITIDPLLQENEATASGGAAGDKFGSAVAVKGNTMVVGAPAPIAGKARPTFTCTPPALCKRPSSTAPDGAAGDAFGTSVSITTTSINDYPFNVVVVGAARRRRWPGRSVRVFRAGHSVQLGRLDEREQPAGRARPAQRPVVSRCLRHFRFGHFAIRR